MKAAQLCNRHIDAAREMRNSPTRNDESCAALQSPYRHCSWTAKLPNAQRRFFTANTFSLRPFFETSLTEEHLGARSADTFCHLSWNSNVDCFFESETLRIRNMVYSQENVQKHDVFAPKFVNITDFSWVFFKNSYHMGARSAGKFLTYIIASSWLS